MLSSLSAWLHGHLNFLVLFGLFGQALFMMRFVAQWIHSEKAQRSVMPEIFWYFSLSGGLILLAYAIIRNDPVFIIGQATGLFIYVRNIVFIWRARLKRRQIGNAQLFDDLSALAHDLAARHKNGGAISHATRRAAAEALQILQAIKK